MKPAVRRWGKVANPPSCVVGDENVYRRRRRRAKTDRDDVCDFFVLIFEATFRAV